MPPVTRTPVGYRVDSVQLLTPAKAISFSMPEGALQKWRGSCAAQATVMENEKKKGQNIIETDMHKDLILLRTLCPFCS